eukprot:scaffold1887_cov267-Chaetoceros_neogracile.AAC.1
MQFTDVTSCCRVSASRGLQLFGNLSRDAHKQLASPTADLSFASVQRNWCALPSDVQICNI